jgi:hypothetical protein
LTAVATGPTNCAGAGGGAASVVMGVVPDGAAGTAWVGACGATPIAGAVAWTAGGAGAGGGTATMVAVAACVTDVVTGGAACVAVPPTGPTASVTVEVRVAAPAPRPMSTMYTSATAHVPRRQRAALCTTRHGVLNPCSSPFAGDSPRLPVRCTPTNRSGPTVVC